MVKEDKKLQLTDYTYKKYFTTLFLKMKLIRCFKGEK